MPSIAARRLIGLDLPLSAFVLSLLFVVAAYGVISGVVSILTASPDDVPGLTVFGGVLLNLVSICCMIALVYGVGRAFGGTGDLPDTLKVMSGLFCVSIVLQTVFLFLTVINPVLALMAVMGTIVWQFWAASHFIAELHGFENRLKVFAAILTTMFAIAFFAALLFPVFGIPLPVPA